MGWVFLVLEFFRILILIKDIFFSQFLQSNFLLAKRRRNWRPNCILFGVQESYALFLASSVSTFQMLASRCLREFLFPPKDFTRLRTSRLVTLEWDMETQDWPFWHLSSYWFSEKPFNVRSGWPNLFLHVRKALNWFSVWK